MSGHGGQAQPGLGRELRLSGVLFPLFSRVEDGCFHNTIINKHAFKYYVTNVNGWGWRRRVGGFGRKEEGKRAFRPKPFPPLYKLPSSGSWRRPTASWPDKWEHGAGVAEGAPPPWQSKGGAVWNRQYLPGQGLTMRRVYTSPTTAGLLLQTA